MCYAQMHRCTHNVLALPPSSLPRCTPPCSCTRSLPTRGESCSSCRMSATGMPPPPTSPHCASARSSTCTPSRRQGLGAVFFVRVGALNYLLLDGNKSRYSKMLIFLTFRHSLRSLHYALFMVYIIHFFPMCIYGITDIPLCGCINTL